MDEDSKSIDPGRNDRFEKLGYTPQKEIIYNKLLPYSDKLDEESCKMLTEIKGNLGNAVLMREIKPACRLWVARLYKYIKMFGLKFSKEDHISLIHLMYELVVIPNLEPRLLNNFAQVLLLLLRKKELLSPKELTLPWRPLYDLCKRITCSRGAIGMYRYLSSLENSLDSLIRAARFYFPVEATQEMLNIWRPKLCPFDSATMLNTFDMMECFLPVALPPELNFRGYNLWFNEFMTLWDVCHNAPNWECEMMWLMARLAHYNIGFIDWEPYIPLMFTRFLRSFHLPVTYKNVQQSRTYKIDTSAMALWIVSVMGGGSSTQIFLDKLMKTLESYFHPANYGCWIMKLKDFLRRLPIYFAQRLHRERYKKNTWETPVPESHKLSEEDITNFVESLKSVALQAMFTKTGHVEVTQTMQHLANLRPNIIIPHIIDRLYANLETLTEPNKLTAAMLCTIAVARPMVQGSHSGYKEGPTHVIPLMIASLPGIDPNDMKKCLMTFQLIATFSTMVPIVDSSKASSYWNNLTEEEEMICTATAGFEDFVLQFMDRSFMLIESSSLENTRLDRDSDKMSKLENMAESALSSSFTSLLMQTSTQIFKSALRKLHLFVTTRILETKVAGQFVAVVVRSFVKVNPEETLKSFLPHLCSTILSLTESEDVIKEDALDEELIYNLLILSQLVDCVGTALLPYITKLEQVLDRTLHLRSRRGYLLATRILSNILVGLSSTTVLEYRSTPKSFDQDVKDFLPIRDWGKPGNIFNLQVKWHTPNKEEVLCAQNLVGKYLLPELDRIKKYVCNEIDMSREELQCSLNVIIAIFGCNPLLPMETENPVNLIESSVPLISANTIDFSYFGTITMPDGSNIRKAVAETVNALQKKLLECKEDDTKSLFYVISIWECILMKNSLNGKYDYRSKNFRMAKKLFEDKVTGQKRHLRQLLVDRVMLQHELLQEKSVMVFTETHQMILLNLFNLSTSHYSEVRTRAQAKLFSAMETFSYSFLTLVPNLVQNLKLDSSTNHEQFKGALFVLLGPKQKPLIARNNWDVLLSLWPSIIGSKPTEKLSVIRLLENIVDCIHKHFSTTMISLEVPDSCINSARKLWDSAPIPQKDMVSPNDINAGLKQLEMKNKGNLEKYHSLLNLLMDAIDTGNLHWRYHGMALNFLRDLVHPDVPYPARIAKFFLHTLIHDSIEARKIAIRSTVFLLKQQKRPHKKIKINPLSFGNDPISNNELVPGERSDTCWIKYNKDTIPLTPEEWDKGRYIHNAYSGYYCWPEDQEVYAPSSEQPSLDRKFTDLSDEEKEVYSFFTNQQNVDKFIQYLSLEDKKGKDKFNGYTFMMFKGLFRNHGDVVLKCFIPHLLRLVGDKQESSQRCAAEIIAGVIRGSKHWPFEKILNLWTVLTPVIETALSNMTVESVADWGVCFATASENRDPNRHHWLLELLMKDPLRDEASFIECGRLYALQGALVQQQWRVSELFNRLLNYLKPFLTHPFQNVRERLGSVITNILAADIVFPNGSRTCSPHISDFINDALPQLKILYDLSVQTTAPKIDEIQNGKVKDVLTKKLKEVTITLNRVEVVQEQNAEKIESSLRLLKTVCRWISGSLLRAQYAAISEYFKIFPLICLMESYDADEEVVKSCKNLLGTLGQSISLPEHIPYALKAVLEVSNSPSWQARLTSLEFLQVYVFHNMPSILSNHSWVEQVIKIVLRLLEDEWLDVRIKASQVLSGLLHCDFVEDTKELMESFKLKAETKKLKRNKSNSSDSKMLEAVRLRHSGVLGMCAFVNAYPYDVPEFVPGVFLKLGEHLNDPEPIPSTIRKTLGDFKRTHHDNWQQHCLKFTEEELAVLGDLTIPPSYYA